MKVWFIAFIEHVLCARLVAVKPSLLSPPSSSRLVPSFTDFIIVAITSLCDYLINVRWTGGSLQISTGSTLSPCSGMCPKLLAHDSGLAYHRSSRHFCEWISCWRDFVVIWSTPRSWMDLPYTDPLFRGQVEPNPRTDVCLRTWMFFLGQRSWPKISGICMP